jgi:hypothetical protein
VGAAAPTPSLSAALGLSYRRLATAGNEALAILRAHLRTHMTAMKPRQISRVGARMIWQLGFSPKLTDGQIAFTASPTTIVHRSRALPPPRTLPFFEDPPPPGGLARAPHRLGTHSKATGAW